MNQAKLVKICSPMLYQIYIVLIWSVFMCLLVFIVPNRYFLTGTLFQLI